MTIIRRLFALIAAAVLLTAAVLPVRAADDPAVGEPAITDESATGYYIWHNDGGFHLRTHGPGDHHLFVAYLHTDGEFRDVETVRGESRDDVAVLDGGHTLALRFYTYGALDGVNFRIEGGSFVRLNLRLDGHLIDTDHIFLGADGVHPARNPFTLWR